MLACFFRLYFISILLLVSLRSVFLKNYVFPMGSNGAANTLPTGMDAMSLDLGGRLRKRKEVGLYKLLQKVEIFIQSDASNPSK